MEALANLGVDWKLFLAQVVNFVVLLFILRRYAYRPMLEFLEKRSSRIEQGLKDAEAAQAKLREMEEKEKEVLSAARHEAKGILTAAEETAKKHGETIVAKTEAEVKRMLAEAEKKIAEEKEKLLAEAKQEIAETVMLAVEKVVREKVDTTKDKELIETAIRS